MACPPRKPKRWTENDIDPGAEKRLAELFERLYQLQPTTDEEDNQQPVVLGLTAAAKKAWVRYYNGHAKEQSELTGDLAAAWSKLEETAARLALIIHCCRSVAGDSAGAVDEESMNAGIELATWFKHEARRVYSMFGESDAEADQRRLVEWIGQKGGVITAREFQQGRRECRTSKKAEEALNELAKAGYGGWHDASPGPKGGRPSSMFKLSTPSTSTKPSESRVLGGCVDVDTVDAPETQPDGDWGEL